MLPFRIFLCLLLGFPLTEAYNIGYPSEDSTGIGSKSKPTDTNWKPKPTDNDWKDKSAESGSKWNPTDNDWKDKSAESGSKWKPTDNDWKDKSTESGSKWKPTDNDWKDKSAESGSKWKPTDNDWKDKSAESGWKPKPTVTVTTSRSNPCYNRPCQNGGTCIPAANNGYSCICLGNASGRNCETNSACPTNSCPTNSDCSISNRQIVCTCKYGYVKNSQNQCVLVDVCAQQQPCKNGGICTNIAPVNGGNAYSCACPVNAGGRCCETRLVCTTSSCPTNSDCSIFNRQIVCTCRNGYVKNTQNQCVPGVVNVCTQQQPCKNGGTCTIVASGYGGDAFSCACPGNTSGRYCETSLVCTTNSCPTNSDCSISNRQIVCACKTGYVRNAQNQCALVDVCAQQQPCKNGGICTNVAPVNGGDAYSCKCPVNAGGRCCETRLVCTTSSCPTNSDCSISNRQIVCTCKSGYAKNARNQCVPVVVDVCVQQKPCKNGGTCLNVIPANGGDAFSCACPGDTSGRYCETTLVCTTNSCPTNSDCSISNRQIVCTCKNGYVKNAQNQCVLVVVVDACAQQQPCKNGGTCTNVTPVNGGDAFSCACPENTSGLYCETTLLCTANSCQANADCSISNRQIVCTCTVGFVLDDQNQCVFVVVVDVCAEQQPCKNGGTCTNETPVNGGDAFSCDCPDNTSGSYCETKLACTSNSCQTNADCSIFDHQIVCTCKNGYAMNAQNQCVVVAADACAQQQPCKNGGTCTSVTPVNGGDAFSSTSCSPNTDCFVQNRVINCVCKQGYAADENGQCNVKIRRACMTGDPHYTTFDGLKFDYQGTCPYVVSQPCSSDINPYFTIRAQNKQWNNYRVSVVDWVELTIYGYVFKVGQNLTLTVNGVPASVPYQLFVANDIDWKVKAYVTAGYMHITTPEHLEIVFSPTAYVLCVNVPEDLVKGTGRLCGLFGDVDSKCQNDLRGIKKNLIGTPPDNCTNPVSGSNGMMAERFGDDWIDDSQGGKCIPGTVLKNTSLPCSPADYIAAKQACQAIDLAKSGRGIFARCSGLGAAKLDELLNNCAYDVCADKSLRCSALTSFVHTCQQTIPGTKLTSWRTNTTCPMRCPANQFYSDCVSGCQRTCANTTAKAVCNEPCLEGCTCVNGTVLDGTGMKCIPQKNCGCTDEKGSYFEAGSIWMNNQCTKAYKCLGSGNLIVKDVTCGSKGTCSSNNQGYQCTCRGGCKGTCRTATDMISNPREYQLCDCK